MGKSISSFGRHRFLMWLMRFLFGGLISFIMGFRFKREKGPDTPSIIICNHNTDMDPALVVIGFSGHLYFVASEHAFRKGILSKFLVFVFGPIPINKVRTDSFTLREIIHRIKSGCSVCIFAEGNRSFNGVTGSIPPATAKLVKMSGASLITYRLEGGYLTTPRWAKKKRKGRITGRVVGRYSASDLLPKTPEEILGIIQNDIHENAFERQKENPVRYRGKDLAEYIETVLYLCPGCKKLGTIHSKGGSFSCGCGLSAEYTETGILKGKDLPFSTIAEWDEWQTAELAHVVNSAGDGPICGDDNQKLYRVESAAGITLSGMGPMSIDRAELRCAGKVFPLQEIRRFAIVDKMTLSFALNDGTQYEIRSDEPRSALKYLEIYRVLRNK